MSESKINIPKFSYPFKKVQILEDYFTNLGKETHGNYLFNKDGFWHGGIHFSDSLTEFSSSEGIRAIADGEIVAFRINDEYLQNDDEKKDNEGLYSNGFFLLKHYLEYPVGNKLTFFSLYMHTGKKQTYFSKITGSGRNIRVGYSNSSNTIKEHTQEFDKDINIITDGKWDKKTNRTKVLYVEGLDIDLSQTPTIHKTNVDNISEVEYFESIGKIFQQNLFNKVKVLETPIQIKAGEVIGLVGEYNINHGLKRDLLHLEVFTGDDVKGFANSAKTAYEKDTSKDKPKPTKIKIQSGKTIYDIKEQSVVESSDGTATIKDSNNIAVSTQAPLNNGTKIEVDTSTIVLNNRYKLLKIDTNDVSSNNWNIYKGSVENIQIAQSTDTTQSEDITLTMSEIKTITLDNKKYVYTNKEQTKGILYSDCIEIHPIVFDWATIIDESSSDDISIFENIKKYLLPDYIEGDLKTNSLYKELFKLIDKDSNGQIDAQELESAAKDNTIKKLTSKYIVKHSTEWDKEINLPQKLIEIYEEYKRGIKSYDKIKQHLDNEEKRVENLNFFEECSSIEGFPNTDKVFHINPIGLVGEFRSKNCNNDKNLGKLSEQYETGGRGSTTVSGGQGDYGGISYGSYQMTSKAGCRVCEFIKSSEFLWSKDFINLTPGDASFSKKWKETAEKYPIKFKESEHAFIKRTHYDIQAKKILENTQLNIKCHSHILNDVVWSTSVQHGPETNIIIKAIKSLKKSIQQVKTYDKELIIAIYNERGRKRTDGNLVYFSKNSQDVQDGVSKRFKSEKNKALEELENENY